MELLQPASTDGAGNRMSLVQLMSKEEREKNRMRNEMIHMLEVQQEEDMQAEKNAILEAGKASATQII